MDTIGLDLHKRETQLCVLTEAEEIKERRGLSPREVGGALDLVDVEVRAGARKRARMREGPMRVWCGGPMRLIEAYGGVWELVGGLRWELVPRVAFCDGLRSA